MFLFPTVGNWKLPKYISVRIKQITHHSYGIVLFSYYKEYNRETFLNYGVKFKTNRFTEQYGGVFTSVYKMHTQEKITKYIVYYKFLLSLRVRFERAFAF
jgi:hypothetical protein